MKAKPIRTCRCEVCTGAIVTPHGRSAYVARRCRCGVCVEANRLYARAWARQRARAMLMRAIAASKRVRR